MRISDGISDLCSSDRTAGGELRYALALNAAGRREDANAAVRRAWTSGPLDDYETSRALSMFPGAITPADHDARMDKLLWLGATAAASRQLAYPPPAKRRVFAARPAMRSDRKSTRPQSSHS